MTAPTLNLTEFSTRILDRISEMVIVTDADLEERGGPHILYVNQALIERTGYGREELIGKPPRMFQGAETDKGARQRIREALRAAQSVQETLLNYTKAGDAYWTELNIMPMRDASGALTHFLAVQRDVTEERQVTEKLNEIKSLAEFTEHHFATARRCAKIGVFDYSAPHDLAYWSDELIEMTGLDAQAFPAPGDSFISGIDEKDRPQFDHLFGRAIDHGEDYGLTVRFHRPDGGLMYMQILAEVRDIKGERRIIGIARDCTEEMEFANRLREEEERFRIIAATVSDGLWDFDLEKSDFWVSPNWSQKLGLTLEDGEFDPLLWTRHIVEEHRDAAIKSVLGALKSSRAFWRYETRMVDADGAEIDIEINATLQRRDDGRVFRMLGNVRNVTIERRQREGFTRSRALEAVGKMTGGIAHDFNNLLSVIQGNAELLELSELSEKARNQLGLIRHATRSAASLTSRLLSFAGQSRLDVAQIDMKQTMAGLHPLLSAALTSAVDLKIETPDDIWPVQADSGAFEQAVINLAVNARDAMDGMGQVEIICENHTLPDIAANEGEAVDTQDLAPGDYVCVKVRDSGPGMSEAVMAQAFEPFFTTKAVGKGTGLGLSTVYGFARQSGGTVTITSRPGQGCTVAIFLPASIHAPSSPGVSQQASGPAEAVRGEA